MLTDIEIRKAKYKNKNQPNEWPSVYKLSDQGGLYIEIRSSGSKLWRYRYRIDGKESVFAIGAYPEISLEKAREVHKGARQLVKQGIHPSHARSANKAEQIAKNKTTFKAVALEWIEQGKAGGWSGYYLRQVEHSLKNDVYPAIGGLPIRSISPAQLLEILKRIEKRGAVTVALNIRGWFSQIFRFAVSTLRADSDPAAALRGAIKRGKVQHSKPLSKSELAKLEGKIDECGGNQQTKIALRLLMHTFLRTGELRQAKWSEVDLEGRTWTIPAERMKMREKHIVPLSRQAIVLLAELHALTGSREHLFPNKRKPKTCMSNTTINRCLERMGYAGQFSGHGFRATASTLLNEMAYRPDLIERQLAHKERNRVRASYNQAEYIKERTEMMQHWSDFIDSLMKSDNVFPILSEARTA